MACRNSFVSPTEPEINKNDPSDTVSGFNSEPKDRVISLETGKVIGLVLVLELVGYLPM